ncbi:MAG TPA: response regulator [Kofleriaceae bacterium]|nr:response regulator [Kofleriaceae bacterium]
MKRDDETERRLRDLERACRVKDELIGALSHELRAPLHAILGWSEVLLARDGAHDDRCGLEAIGRNARIQAQIIEDVLDLSRIVSGKLRLELRPTDVQAVVAAAIETVQPLATAKHQRLTPVIDPQARHGDADPQRLQQIVAKLLAEAIRATPARGEIALAVRRVDTQLELAVSVAGAMPVTEDGAGRTGVGLAIVKALVELHGGSLRAEPTGAHAGFLVRWPMQAATAAARLARPAPLRAAPGEQPWLSLDGIKVLVVDDDSDALELVKVILTGARADAITAGSADEGLAVLRDYKPDVIISDIGMALRDGYQFIRLLRTMSTSDGGRTPALALTAFAQTEDRARALLAGFQDHIPKPFEARQLLAAVHRLSRRATEGSIEGALAVPGAGDATHVA